MLIQIALFLLPLLPTSLAICERDSEGWPAPPRPPAPPVPDEGYETDDEWSDDERIRRREINQPTIHVPFSAYLEQVRKATYSEYACTRVSDARTFEEMKHHVAYMYAGVRRPALITSFIHGGKYADCIPVAEQPAVHHSAQKTLPRPLPPANLKRARRGGETVYDQRGARNGERTFRSVDSPLKLKNLDRFGNTIACVPGTIPMERMTLELMTQWPTLQDYQLAGKAPPPGPKDARKRDWRRPGVKTKRQAGAAPALPAMLPAIDAEHKHVVAGQAVENYGLWSWIELWNPNADFSISQQWLIGPENYSDPGFECQQQSVEGGWIKTSEPGIANEIYDIPSMFIFFNNNNYNRPPCFSALYMACYNLRCDAFKQMGHEHLLGGIFDNYSDKGAIDAFGFDMQWKLQTDGWCLYFRGTGDWDFVGCYNPDYFFNGVMTQHASWAQFGGETSRRAGSAYPEMGNGEFGSTGWDAATQWGFSIIDQKDKTTGPALYLDNMVQWQTNTATTCYNGDLLNYPDCGVWGNCFHFGGPGGSSAADNCR